MTFREALKGLEIVSDYAYSVNCLLYMTFCADEYDAELFGVCFADWWKYVYRLRMLGLEDEIEVAKRITVVYMGDDYLALSAHAFGETLDYKGIVYKYDVKTGKIDLWRKKVSDDVWEYLELDGYALYDALLSVVSEMSIDVQVSVLERYDKTQEALRKLFNVF